MALERGVPECSFARVVSPTSFSAHRAGNWRDMDLKDAV
jgi:hypothetical protein